MREIFRSVFVDNYWRLAGRASRREYWTAQIIFLVIHFLAYSLALVIHKAYYAAFLAPVGGNEHDLYMAGVKFFIAVAVFSLPTYLWRHVGWLVVVVLVPLFFVVATQPLSAVGNYIAAGAELVRVGFVYVRPVIIPALPVLLATLYLLPPSIAVTVRRFHDRGMPGVVVFLVPEFVGFIIDLLAGNRRDNRYGPPPVV